MRVDFYGLGLDAPCISFGLLSPWRAMAIEHRLFKAVEEIPQAETQEENDGQFLHFTDPRGVRQAWNAVSRVLKGWQEDADPGVEKRTWRWLLEADVDGNGYDGNGEAASLWGVLRLSIDRGGPEESDKGEDIELEGFSMRIWPNKES